MIVLPSVAGIRLLNDLLDQIDAWFHLAVQPVTLDVNTTLGSFTEADWFDYAPLRVTTWANAVWIDYYAVSWADPCVWTWPGGQPPPYVYCYWVTDGQTGPLLWCEAPPIGPILLNTVGQTVRVYPQLTSFACQPPPAVVAARPASSGPPCPGGQPGKRPAFPPASPAPPDPS